MYVCVCERDVCVCGDSECYNKHLSAVAFYVCVRKTIIVPCRMSLFVWLNEKQFYPTFGIIYILVYEDSV